MAPHPLVVLAVPSKPVLQVQPPLLKVFCWLRLLGQKARLGYSGRAFSSRIQCQHSYTGRAWVTKMLSASPFHFSQAEEDCPSQESIMC